MDFADIIVRKAFPCKLPVTSHLRRMIIQRLLELGRVVRN